MEKNVHKNFRITQKEWDHIQMRCEMYGVTPSEYARRLIDADMGKQIQIPTKEEFLAKKQLTYEVNRIGNNINQIVKNVNMHFYTDYEKKKLFALMRRVMELFENQEKESSHYGIGHGRDAK